jgi:CheY-like chemotaxis protein
MKVLVVDDDEDIVEILSLSLSAYRGWTVETLTSGPATVEVCRWFQPDAILLDVEMPILDGPGVLAQLRSDPGTAGVPVVFVTGATEPTLDARLRALGAAAVLPKPFDPVSIGDDVAVALGW